MSRCIEVPSSIDLSDGKRARVQAEGLDIVVFNIGGEFFAIDDSCPHRGASLGAGKLEGRMLQCPAHGLRFDVASGCMPGNAGLKVNAYPVEQVNGQIRITVSSVSPVSANAPAKA